MDQRAQEEIPMNESPVYRLRLLERHVFHDISVGGSQQWREWKQNDIVSDPDDIRLLIARKAPCEKIEMKPETSLTK